MLGRIDSARGESAILNLGLDRAEPSNSPSPTVGSASGAGETVDKVVAAGDAGGEGGRGTDAGSARYDGSSPGGSTWRAGIRTAGRVREREQIRLGSQVVVRHRRRSAEKVAGVSPPHEIAAKDVKRSGNSGRNV